MKYKKTNILVAILFTLYSGMLDAQNTSVATYYKMNTCRRDIFNNRSVFNDCRTEYTKSYVSVNFEVKRCNLDFLDLNFQFTIESTQATEKGLHLRLKDFENNRADLEMYPSGDIGFLYKNLMIVFY